jgi:hypothetical protein
MLSPLPSVHGGLEKGGLPATSNMMREDKGIPIESDLIHDRGKLDRLDDPMPTRRRNFNLQ